MEELVFGFVLSHGEDFHDMFAGYLEKNSENFLREIKRNLVSKTTRMKQLENKKGKLPDSDIVANMESALTSAFYMHLRHLYNSINTYGISTGTATGSFFLVRENASASMFRSNSQGGLNSTCAG